MVHGTPHIFFRNKTFLFVKIEIQHLFDLEFRETLQNFSSFRQTFRRRFSMGNKSCPIEFHKIINQRDAESFRLTNKKGLFLTEILSVPCTMDNYFFSQQVAP